jgi:hypothetical protein
MKKTTNQTIDKGASFDVCFSVCRNCMFWLEDMEIPRIGMCIRHAPRPDYAIYSTCAEKEEKREKGRVYWPETKATDVCGEWQSQVVEEYPEVTDLRF